MECYRSSQNSAKTEQLTDQHVAVSNLDENPRPVEPSWASAPIRLEVLDDSSY